MPEARRQAPWTAVKVRPDGSHPWLVKRDGEWPSQFSPDVDVADWLPVEMSDAAAAGFFTFARQFAT